MRNDNETKRSIRNIKVLVLLLL